MKNSTPGASRFLRYLAAVFFAGLLAGLPVGAIADGNEDFDIVPLSSPPYAVSGGTVLVRVDLPPNVPSNDLVITLNGQAVTSAFRPVSSYTLIRHLFPGPPWARRPAAQRCGSCDV